MLLICRELDPGVARGTQNQGEGIRLWHRGMDALSFKPLVASLSRMKLYHLPRLIQSVLWVGGHDGYFLHATGRRPRVTDVMLASGSPLGQFDARVVF